MAEFKPSWSDSFKFDGGSFGGGGGGGVSSYWQPDPGAFNDFDSGSWSKGFGLKGNDPFGLDKDKKESPWGDVARFAGNKLSEYAKNRYGQSDRSDGLAVGGGGGVSQSGDLTIVYPQPQTVIPAQKGGLGSTIGSIAGAALGSFIPGVGTALGAGLGGSIGGAFG